MNLVVSSIALLLSCSMVINGDLNINIRMSSFLNPYSVKLNGEQCTNGECNTFFRFCIKSASPEISEPCKAEFESEIIGHNSINSEQFKLTTDLIQLGLKTEQYLSSSSSDDFTLSIEVLNDKIERALISQFTVDIHQLNLNNWEKFSAKNSFNQELEIDYRLDCANHFGGKRCDEPICPEVCQNGGKCQIVNQKPMCKCNPFFSEGRLCEIKIVHACTAKCMNGGSCLGNGECLCAPGYTGSRCQSKRLPSQCGQVTCYNGGTCMIDNRNEYACMCHPAFTGKYCDARIESTTTTTTTTTSRLPEVFKSKVTYLHIARKSLGSRSYSVQEIILIIVLGVGMPVFAILCTVLLCRLSRSSSRSNKAEMSSSSENCEFDRIGKKTKNIEQLGNVQEGKACNTNVNIFNENEVNETKVCVKTISSELRASRTPMKMKKQNGFNLVENNIYSVFNYSDKVSQAEGVNLKNSNRNKAKLNQMCQMQQQQSEYGALSSIV